MQYYGQEGTGILGTRLQPSVPGHLWPSAGSGFCESLQPSVHDVNPLSQGSYSLPY